MDVITQELSEVLFKNFIRLVKNGKTSLKYWHTQHVSSLVEEAKKARNEIVLIKHFMFCVELTFWSLCGQDARQA